ncbi:MAG: hypothetical protein AAF243_14635 [Cyanobacteria bacterium P01_A01_bin.137]
MTLLQRFTTTTITLLAIVAYPTNNAIAQPSPELQRAERLLQAADELSDSDTESADSITPGSLPELLKKSMACWEY